jgi:hypothetical protein
MPEKTPGQWTVEETKEADDGIWIRVAESGSYEADEHVPEVGQVLVVKTEETK